MSTRRQIELEAEAMLMMETQSSDRSYSEVPQWGQEHPSLYGIAGVARDTLGPLVEMTGLVGGGYAGSQGGVNPVGGAMGASLGYGAAKSLTNQADVWLGNRPDPGLMEAAKESAKDAGMGAMMEMGGQLAIPLLKPVVKPIWDRTGKPLINAGRNFFEPILEGGINRVAGRQLNTGAGKNQSEIVRLLRANEELVPGSQGTAAEVAAPAGQAEFSGLERAVKSYRPTDYEAQRVAQNTARTNALNTVGQDKEALRLAQQLRKQETSPLYAQVDKTEALADPTRTVNLIDRIINKNPAREQLVSTLGKIRNSLFEYSPIEQRVVAPIKDLTETMSGRMSSGDSEALRQTRLILNRVKSGKLDADEAILQIGKIKPTSQTAQSSKQFALDSLKTPDYVLRQEPAALQSASKNIGDLLNAKSATGTPINEAIRRELTAIKKSIDHQINKAVPEYGQAQKVYSEMSEPIDQMKVGQYLANQLTKADDAFGATSTQSAAALTRALRDESNVIKKTTGFRREEMADVLTPQQLSTVEGVARDLTRKATAEDLASKGLPQALRDLGDISAIKLPNALHRPIMIINAFLNRVMGKAQGQTLVRLSEVMQNPALAADLMEQASRPEIEALTKLVNVARGRSLGALGTSQNQ